MEPLATDWATIGTLNPGSKTFIVEVVTTGLKMCNDLTVWNIVFVLFFYICGCGVRGVGICRVGIDGVGLIAISPGRLGK